jgi:hypothetical protein
VCQQTFPALLALLNDRAKCDLSLEYTLPKIKSKFKGEHTAAFATSNATPLSGGAVFDGSSPPERHSGTARRQEGALLKSFKQRFFVLQSGVLLVYKTEADFTSNNKEMDMIAFNSYFSVSEVNGRGKEAPELCLYVFDTEDTNVEILLKFENETEFQNWKHHLKQNLAYVEYKAANLLF